MNPLRICCLLIVVCLISYVRIFGQNEFKLHATYKRSDINYLTIKNISKLEHGYDAMLQHFEPVKGQYKVYVFLKESKGTSILLSDSENPDSLIVFHDLILLKTNKDNEILDAFFYRLEWAEVPGQFMVFRSFCEPMKLVDNLSVSALNFLNEYEIYSGVEIPEYYDTNEYGQRILKFFETDVLKL